MERRGSKTCRRVSLTEVEHRRPLGPPTDSERGADGTGRFLLGRCPSKARKRCVTTLSRCVEGSGGWRKASGTLSVRDAMMERDQIRRRGGARNTRKRKDATRVGCEDQAGADP